MKKIITLLLGILLTSSFTIIAFANEDQLFTDGHLLYDLGVISGKEGGRLDQNSELTRQEMVAILNRISMKGEGEFVLPITPTFSDVPSTHWAYRDVELAAYNGITSGIGDGKFGLDEKINYNQVVLFLLRALNYETSEIKYELASEIAMESYGLNLDYVVSGDDNLNRAQIFNLLKKTLNMHVKGKELKLVDSLNFELDKVESFTSNYDLATQYLGEGAIIEEIEDEVIIEDLANDKGEANVKTSEISYDYHLVEELAGIEELKKYAGFNEYMENSYLTATEIFKKNHEFANKYLTSKYDVISFEDGLKIIDDKNLVFICENIGVSTNDWYIEQGIELYSVSSYISIIVNPETMDIDVFVNSTEGNGENSGKVLEFRKHDDVDDLSVYSMIFEENKWNSETEEMNLGISYIAFTVGAEGNIIETIGSESYGQGYAKY